MKLTLNVWRQAGPEARGDFAAYEVDGATEEMSFLELAELTCIDALHRSESCGGHFREESQTPEGEALRDDERFSYVAGWEFTGVLSEPVLHKEPLAFDYVHPSQRSYK